jgi:hypothetical protein
MKARVSVISVEVATLAKSTVAAARLLASGCTTD